MRNWTIGWWSKRQLFPFDHHNTANFGLYLYRYEPNTTGWIDPWGWFCGSNQGHHTYPKYLGGDKVQDLVKLSTARHKQAHKLIADELEAIFGTRSRRMSVWNGIRDIKGNQEKITEAIRTAYTKMGDSKLLSTFEDVVIKGLFNN